MSGSPQSIPAPVRHDLATWCRANPHLAAMRIEELEGALHRLNQSEMMLAVDAWPTSKSAVGHVDLVVLRLARAALSNGEAGK